MDFPLSFIGIPYASRGRSLDGADCYGLVGLVARHVQGRALPEVTGYTLAHDSDQVSKAVATSLPDWQPIPFEKRQPFDVILFNLLGYPVHMGVVIDNNKMLHTLRGCESVIERYTSIVWNRRIEGVYRWRN